MNNMNRILSEVSTLLEDAGKYKPKDSKWKPIYNGFVDTL